MNNQRFTVGGIIVLAFVLWITGATGSKEVRHMINLFLLVLLVSIIMIRWDVISPFLFKGPSVPVATGGAKPAPSTGGNTGVTHSAL